MGKRGRVAVALAASAAVALGIVRVSVARQPVARSVALGYTATVASVSVSPTVTAGPITSGFLGLAFEYSNVPAWAGSPGTPSEPVDPVLVRLIRNLDPVGHPVIRVGGLSTDHTWWPVPGMRQPLGVTFALSPAWTASARALAQALDARLILGVDLEANNLRLDRVEADELLSQIGRRWIGAVNIGNEPPLYASIPWYHLLHGTVLPWYAKQGTPVLSRGAGWGPLSFTDEFQHVLAVMPAGVPIAGPDTEQASWFAAFVRLLSPRSRLRILTSHGYGLNNCVKRPGNPSFPSVPHMLSAFAAFHLLPGLTRYVQLAHADGATFRIDEMGSVTCNGHPGVSNTFATALWAADALFAVAATHVDGVNLHSFPGLSNTPFDFTHAPSGWTGEVHPLYYGLLLFADAAPVGSHLLKVTAAGPSTFHAWATGGPGPVLHVLLINDSIGAPASAVVQVPASYAGGRAQVTRLSAPSAYATGGITLGGRSFGTQTSTGVLAPPIRDALAPSAGDYRVSLHPASALLLTLNRAARRAASSAG
jgi:hypothetical protein